MCVSQGRTGRASTLVWLAIGLLILSAPAMARDGAEAVRPTVPRAVLPPGDISGRIIEADGITPHGNVTVALRDGETGRLLQSTRADAKGRFVLRNVAVGSYVVYVGNPGIGAMLTVSERAPAGALNLTVPKALSLPKPAALPQWWKQQPTSTKAAITGGALLLLGGGYYLYEHHDDKATGGKFILSPIRTGDRRRWSPPPPAQDDDDDDDYHGRDDDDDDGCPP